MADLSASDIIVSILNGDHDKELADIASAILDRQKSGVVRLRWWVHVDDRYLTPESMNIVAARYFQRLTGIRWEDADPSELEQRIAIVQAQLVEGDDMDPADAIGKLRGYREADLTSGEYAQVNPPKEEPPSTG